MKDYSILIAAIVSFIVTGILGFIVIPYLRRLKFGQTILDEGPKWHKEKQGTPTMGGIMIVAGFVLGLAAAYGFSAISESRFALELK